MFMWVMKIDYDADFKSKLTADETAFVSAADAFMDLFMTDEMIAPGNWMDRQSLRSLLFKSK